MGKTQKPVDIVIIGAGWAGGILAKELAGTGQSIVILERGGETDTTADFAGSPKFDELRFAHRHDLLQNLSRETLTVRNTRQQTALPMRQWGSFVLGEGVGGSGLHWNGHTWRWLPWDHQALTHTLDRYGRAAIPDGMLLQDWPVSYDELEPYYDRFERLCGTSGQAGNLNGTILPGGNPFEGRRRSHYPNPPLLKGQASLFFDKAAAELGLHSFPLPASNATRDYVNPDGVAFGACQYCGFCERFGCETDAKASPHFVTIPVALRHPNVELRPRSQVLRVDMAKDGRQAVGVTYLDGSGQEIHQPAALVILAAYTFGNVHLMLHSGIGRPYDPETGTGVVGRGYAYQTTAGAPLLFDDRTWLNSFMGAGGSGVGADDFNAGNPAFDSLAQGGFIGGISLAGGAMGARPISATAATPPGAPRWGAGWKQAVVGAYQRSSYVFGMGSVMASRGNYLDLDPTYRDAFGRPLLRMTFDFQPNEVRQMTFMADRAAELGRATGAIQVGRRTAQQPYAITAYQTTHNTGGAVFGSDPETSALNRYLQSWDVPNVFVVGASAFPFNAAKNPTGPVGALALWAADAIRNRYLPNPGPLA